MKRKQLGITKRIASVFLSLALLAPLTCGMAIDVSAIDGVPSSAQTVMTGIDVSAWQETVDWASVKAAGVQFAMIRICTYNTSTGQYAVDPMFAANVAGAKAAGIHLGAYFFSYANSVEDVVAEANMVINILKDYPATFAFPIVFDAESDNVKSFAGDACATFVTALRTHGYYPMVYANTNWLNNYIDPAAISGMHIWQAHYLTAYAGYTPAQGLQIAENRPTINKNDANVAMWQYTDSGVVPGVDGDCDMNVSYVDYSKIIPTGGYNGYVAERVNPTFNESYAFNAMGAAAPDAVLDDPAILLTEVGGMTNSYFGLEQYGINKELVLINGRTWEKWDTRSPKAIERLWVYADGDGRCYLGLALNDHDALRLNTQAGEGEVLESIVFKKGFQIVSSTGNLWGVDGSIHSGSNYVSGVLKTLSNHMVLVAKPAGGFNVYVDGLDKTTYKPITLSGYVIGAEGHVTVTGSSVYICPTPAAATAATALGTAVQGDTFDYLNETSDHWYKILYNGNEAWISGNYSTLETSSNIEITPLNADFPHAHDYEFNYDRDVHWKACKCGLSTEKTEHVFKDGVCECGYEFIPAVVGNIGFSGSGSGAVTIALFKQGQTAASHTLTAETKYVIEGVADGTYTMQVSKTGYVTREYTVTVSGGNAVQDVELWMRGDVDGNGKITAVDKKMYFNHINQTDGYSFTDYRFKVGDLDEDGSVNAKDKKMIYNHISGLSLLW